ncbi:alpha/beta hydrolase fold domain-containing protein [Phthorimaea operculella]|nr:alpha/beta hydrolase fold domain-containing protein [Phthorimaea operculella]
MPDGELQPSVNIKRKEPPKIRTIPIISPNLDEPVPPEYLQLRNHPTALLPTDELILFHEKVPEVHTVLTADGYYLTVHRVLLPNFIESASKGSVLLHHGLLGSSADWLMLGAEKSLPYLLNKAGYDVWMINARGNYYSQKHLKLSTKSIEFWNFTWQEMGQYDLPAVIDYIRYVKGHQENLYFIGHSMGATAFLVMLATSRNYNDQIRMGVLLAPLTVISENKVLALYKENQTTSEYGEYFPRRKVPEKLSKKYCRGHRLFCRNPLFILTGGLHNSSPFNKNRDFLATLLSHVPAGGSTKTVAHYAQLADSRKFHPYGDIKNRYLLSEVKVPLHIFSSSDDSLCSTASVKNLMNNIAAPLKHVALYNKNITHTEFVWGHTADKLVFKRVLRMIKYFNPAHITKQMINNLVNTNT